jgi:hypothetical protein
VDIAGKNAKRLEEHCVFIVNTVLKVFHPGKRLTSVWCTKSCAAKDECHAAENKFLTCRYSNKPWLSWVLKNLY